MKSRLALLAVPFLALACSDAEQATLLEPPAISADVILAAPVGGQFEALVKQFWPTCAPDATQVGPDWEIFRGSGNVCLVAHVTEQSGGANVTKGAVVWQACRESRKGFGTSKAACAAGNGVWLKLSGEGGGTKVDGAGVAKRSSLNTGPCGNPDNGPFGFRYQFKGGGQVKSGFSAPFDITIKACP